MNMGLEDMEAMVIKYFSNITKLYFLLIYYIIHKNGPSIINTLELTLHLFYTIAKPFLRTIIININISITEKLLF